MRVRAAHFVGRPPNVSVQQQQGLPATESLQLAILLRRGKKAIMLAVVVVTFTGGKRRQRKHSAKGTAKLNKQRPRC